LSVRAASAAKAVAAGKAGATPFDAEPCYEAMHDDGMCYRSCTSLGAMEPRESPVDCSFSSGQANNVSCASRDQQIAGPSQPGSGPRSKGQCLSVVDQDTTDEATSGAVNVCMKDCPLGAPDASVHVVDATYCCSDWASQPLLTLIDDVTLVCSCPNLGDLGQPSREPGQPSQGQQGTCTMFTPAQNPCDTGCNNRPAWIEVQGVRACCPNDEDRPTGSYEWDEDDLVINCQCSIGPRLGPCRAPGHNEPHKEHCPDHCWPGGEAL